MPPPVFFGVALVAGLVLDATVSSFGVPVSLRVLGAALTSIAAGLAVWFFASFRRAGTPVDLRKPTTVLVTDGPYRLTRNPGYLSLAAGLVGVALALDAPWVIATAAAATGAVDRVVIAREERYLRRRFGATYDAYTQRTRRWL